MNKTIILYVDQRDAKKLIELPSKDDEGYKGGALESMCIWNREDILHQYRLTIHIDKKELPIWYRLKVKWLNIWKELKRPL